MPFAENLDAFLADFAVTATLPSGSNVAVIFDNGARMLLDVMGSEPVCQAKSSDVSGIEYGDTLLIQGAGYTVRGIEPDGTGMTTLRLES